MTTRTAEVSQSTVKETARRAGILYGLLTIMGIFNLFYVPSFVVPGDATATAHNITAGDLGYRVGILTGLVILILFMFLVLCLYDLLKDVDKRQARLMVLLVSVGVTIALANDLIDRIAPLTLLSGDDYLSVFTKPQLDALALSFLTLHSNGDNVVTAFWGLWLLPFGILVIKSGFFPKILGILLMIAGVAYVISSFTSIVSPAYGHVVSQVISPLYLGEFPIIVWLIVKGANVAKMDARPLQTD